MKINAFFYLSMLLFWPSAGLYAQPWSGVIDPARAIDWSTASPGVNGGIPTGWPACTSAQAGTTIPIAAYGSLAAPGGADPINNAIASCAAANPTGSVVLLGSGTFYINASLSTGGYGINFKTASNVILRGQGANSTIIRAVNEVDACGGVWGIICIQGGNAYIGTGTDVGKEQNVCDWTSGYAQGSTTISLGNCGTTTPNVGSLSHLKIGSLVMLDQLSEQKDTGNVWNCQINYQESDAAHSCSSEGGTYRSDGTCIPTTIPWFSPNWCVREQSQIVRVTNCTNSGGTCTSSANITVDPPIRMPNWSGGKLPQAWFANSYLSNDGIENLAVDTGDPASGSLSGGSGSHWPNLVLYDCYNCWIKGVASFYADRSHVMLNQCQHCEVRDSYLFQNIGHATQSYCAEYQTVGESKFENNISQGCTDGMPINTLGGEANVMAFNYSARTTYTATTQAMQQSVYLHDSGDAFNLYEGNVGQGINSDDVHGTHHFHTLYRNLFTGWETDCNGTGCSASTYAMKIQAGSRFYNIVGNVIGTAGYHTTYQCLAPAGYSGFPSCAFYSNPWELGYAELGTNQLGFCQTAACTATVVNGYDPITLASLLRYGNYDTATGVVHWCGNSSNTGWSTTCGSTTEVPSATFSPYGNPVPTLGDVSAGQGALPASFLYASKPSWWGSHAWPAVGPDVTGGNVGVCSGGSFAKLPASSASQCTGGTLATGWSGHVSLIPAMDCYLNVMNGPVDGEYPGNNNSGTPLSFNAAACYSGAPAGPPPQPMGSLTSSIK